MGQEDRDRRLVELGEGLAHHDENIGRWGRKKLAAQWAYGRDLAEAQELIGHGNSSGSAGWEAWLEQYDVAPRTARRYLELYEFYPKSANLSDFRSMSAALKSARTARAAELNAAARAVAAAREEQEAPPASDSDDGDPGEEDGFRMRGGLSGVSSDEEEEDQEEDQEEEAVTITSRPVADHCPVVDGDGEEVVGARVSQQFFEPVNSLLPSAGELKGMDSQSLISLIHELAARQVTMEKSVAHAYMTVRDQEKSQKQYQGALNRKKGVEADIRALRAEHRDPLAAAARIKKLEGDLSAAQADLATAQADLATAQMEVDGVYSQDDLIDAWRAGARGEQLDWEGVDIPGDDPPEPPASDRDDPVEEEEVEEEEEAKSVSVADFEPTDIEFDDRRDFVRVLIRGEHVGDIFENNDGKYCAGVDVVGAVTGKPAEAMSLIKPTQAIVRRSLMGLWSNRVGNIDQL